MSQIFEIQNPATVITHSLLSQLHEAATNVDTDIAQLAQQRLQQVQRGFRERGRSGRQAQADRHPGRQGVSGVVTGRHGFAAKHFEVASGTWIAPERSGAIHVTRRLAMVRYVVFRGDGMYADETRYTFADEAAAIAFTEQLRRGWPTPAPLPKQEPLERYPAKAHILERRWAPPFEKLMDVSTQELIVIKGEKA